MQQSWLKRFGLAVAGLVLRVFGMKLNADPSLPADEYGAHGAYRTPDPPATEAPPVEPRPSLLSRLNRLVPSFLQSREFRLTVGAAAAAAVTIATIWGVYYLFVQNVPDISAYQLSTSVTVDGVTQQPWIISLPFAVSHLWDVAYAALWTVALCLLVLSYRNNCIEEEEGVPLMIGLISSVIIGLLVAMCVGCDDPNTPAIPVSTWRGIFAAALVAPAVAALVASVLTTCAVSLAGGLRTCWCICLVAGFVAGIVFGPPGGLLYCFAAGAFITVFNALIGSFVALGRGD